MNKGRVAAVGGFGVLLLVTSVVLGWYGFPTLVVQQIKHGVSLRNDTDAFQRWEKLPQPMHFKVYMFNVTNPHEVNQGGQPVLQEVGPYVYNEYREKFNIIDHPEDETMSYQQNTTFFFNEEMSGSLNQDDVVTILNPGIMGMALKVQASMPFALGMMNPVLKEIFPSSQSIFLTAPVRDILFDGVVMIDCVNSGNLSDTASLVCEGAESHLPPTVRRVHKDGIFKFAMCHYKNGTADGWYRVKRGLTNSSDIGHLTAWNNASHVDTWPNKYCGMINGTDSTVFPPFLTSDEKIYIFTTDLCRSMYAEFEKNVEVKGVPALRYVGSPNLLRSGNNYTDNKCYCGGKRCLKDGVMDLSPCLRAPVIMSLPHFLLADPVYQNYPIGLRPDHDLHQTFIEIESKTGTPLRGGKRMQLNMFLKRIPQLDLLVNVSQGLFPIMWLEEGVTLDDENIALVQTVYKKLSTLDTVKWLILGISVVIILVAMCMYVSMRNRRVKDAHIHDKQVSVSTIDSILHSDCNIAVQTFAPPAELKVKRTVGEVFN